VNRRRDDRGAALVAVLILVTAVASVLAVVLSLTETSERTTIQLRQQASTAYAADGAATAAVRQLQSDTFGAGDCVSTEVWAPSNFYPAVGGAKGASVAVRCTPDPTNINGGTGGNSSPGSALLSLGTSVSEDGIWDGSVNTRTFKVSGGIFSNSTINLAGNSKSVIENVSTNSYVRALGSCYGPGSIVVTGSTTKICNYSSDPLSANDRRGLDPQTVPGHGSSFDPPAAPTTTPTVPACTNKAVYELQPGLYRDAPALNALTNSGNSGPCGRSIVHLNPGTYYFDFTNGGSHVWTTSSAWVVGGTPTAQLKVNNPPAMTAANPSCVAPGAAGSSASSGVMLVFGGDSRMDWTSSGVSDGNIELCASNAASGPPVAIYGLKSTIGSGSMQVAATSGCLRQVPYPSTGCALLKSYQDPNPIFTVRGTVYAPTAPVDIVFNNSAAQYFRWGLVARTIRIDSTGSANALASSVISVPDDAPAPFPSPSYYYLDVFVCPGASTCSTSGQVRLRVKMQRSASSPYTMTVLSWSTR
jgi:Tfp pilus assembly protein PilX